jgi:hypothetical protein
MLQIRGNYKLYFLELFPDLRLCGELYGLYENETCVLNQSVRRNIERLLKL